MVSNLDVVPRANSAVIPVPPTVDIYLVDLAQKVYSLTLHRVNILQLLDYVDVPRWMQSTEPYEFAPRDLTRTLKYKQLKC